MLDGTAWKLLLHATEGLCREQQSGETRSLLLSRKAAGLIEA